MLAKWQTEMAHPLARKDHIICSSVSTHSNDPLKFPAIPLVIGIISGLLTAEAARFLELMNPWLGTFFGVEITILIWLKYRSCSVWIAVALIASSVVAYFTSIWGGLTLIGYVDRFLGSTGSSTDFVDPGTFAVAGFLGALIVNTALLLLFPPGGLRLLGKAAAWSCVGAFLGILGSELSGPVGTTVAAVVGGDPRSASVDLYHLSCYSAYLIWQTGMAFTVPLMLPAAQDQAVSMRRSPAQFSWFGKLFFSGMLAALLLISYSNIRNWYRAGSFQRETDRLVQETPSAENLPFVEPRPLEQMLILHEIAGYAELGATRNAYPARTVHVGSKGALQKLAAHIAYRIEYQKAAPGLTDQWKATVTISEFPTEEWAKFQLKNDPAFGTGPYLYIYGARTTRFGPPVFLYTGGGKQHLSALWQSSNRVLVVTYPQEAEEIVRQYLAKYPSSM